MKQTSELTRRLAQAQEDVAALQTHGDNVLFTILTEDKHNTVTMHRLTRRYFSGATFTEGEGFYEGKREDALRIDILGRRDDLQSVVNLAGDIGIANSQESVIVLQTPVTRINVVTPDVDPDDDMVRKAYQDETD